MPTGDVVVMTDHASAEGSRAHLGTAVELLTGVPPLMVDARQFMDGGRSRATLDAGDLVLYPVDEESIVAPAAVIVYEVPPAARGQFVAFQDRLGRSTTVSLGADAGGWRDATEKNTVEVFLREGIAHMPTISLSGPTEVEAVRAFEALGGDVWARPTVGLGGADVFHVASHEQLREVAGHYARKNTDWLIARDAMNFNSQGRRHQFRVVVLGDQILRVCEHVQANPDAPCNEAQGAVSAVLAVRDVPLGILDLAVAATRSLGLPFGGVDVAAEGGGVVFEVNVHPVIAQDGGLTSVAIPYVAAHLSERSTRGPSTR